MRGLTVFILLMSLKKGTLHWMFSCTPADVSSHGKKVLCNAESTELHRMGKKGDVSDFEPGMVVGARWAV